MGDLTIQDSIPWSPPFCGLIFHSRLLEREIIWKYCAARVRIWKEQFLRYKENEKPGSEY